MSDEFYVGLMEGVVLTQVLVWWTTEPSSKGSRTERHIPFYSGVLIEGCGGCWGDVFSFHLNTHTGDGHALFDLLIASESKYSCRSSTCAPISSNVSQHAFWGFQSRWDLFPTARRRNETTYVWLSNSEGRFNQNSITISLLHTQSSNSVLTVSLSSCNISSL